MRFRIQSWQLKQRIFCERVALRGRTDFQNNPANSLFTAHCDVRNGLPGSTPLGRDFEFLRL